VAGVLNHIKTKAKITRTKQSRTRKRSAHKATVTVVIPVLNESRTISNVVKFALRDPRVAEVLVVDDGSIDGAPDMLPERRKTRNEPDCQRSQTGAFPRNSLACLALDERTVRPVRDQVR